MNESSRCPELDSYQPGVELVGWAYAQYGQWPIKYATYCHEALDGMFQVTVGFN
jgi:hypothetical protein